MEFPPAPPWAIQLNATLTATLKELRRDIARALSYERAHNALMETVVIPRGRPPTLDENLNIAYPIPLNVFFCLTVGQIDIQSAWCESPGIVGGREPKLRSLCEFIGVHLAQ